MIVENIRI